MSRVIRQTAFFKSWFDNLPLLPLFTLIVTALAGTLVRTNGAVPEILPGRGFYFAPIDVRISAAGANLVVTTDSSEPSLTHRVVASTNVTLHITNTTIVRAAAFRDGSASSSVVTHSYIFPASVGSQSAPSGAATIWPGPDGSVKADFGMDRRVTENALTGYKLTNALLAIPTVSIAMPSDQLFGTNGIYVQSLKNGAEWTRNASIELIYPNGRTGFQQNAGLKLRGGASRFPKFTPKHAFTALFQTNFGPKALDFPLFPDSSRQKFKRLVFRCNSCDSWPVTEWSQQIINGELRWRREQASYVRDQWVRDAQRAMGHPSAHGIFAHLYLNGLYWGVYNVTERPDAEFAAEYFGADKKDYDVISDGTDLHSGTRNAWNELRSAVGLQDETKFQRLLGNNPDGTRNPKFRVLLDVTNLVDYILLHIFIGADDWPEHNWWVVRDRSPQSTGFKFIAWDQEVSINSLVKQHTAWALLRGGAATYADESWGNTPAEVYSHCRASAAFRQLFAQRVQRHLFNDGALSVSNNIARWRRLEKMLDCAVVAESARWGDFQRPAQPFRREVEWLAANKWECSVYFPSNHFVALKRFRDAKLYQ